MGLRDALRGKRVYFDANVFIYLLEGFAALEPALLEIRDSIAYGEAEIFTTELTLCEVLVVPFRHNNIGLVSQYRQFIEHSGAFSVAPVTRNIFIRASLYRAQFNLKTPDAIHMASASELGCEVFVSNDAGIRGPKGMEIVGLG